MLEKIKLLTKPYHLYLGFFAFLAECKSLLDSIMLHYNRGNPLLINLFIVITALFSILLIASGLYSLRSKEESLSKKINLFIGYIAGTPILLISILMFLVSTFFIITNFHIYYPQLKNKQRWMADDTAAYFLR